jgi:ethanolamine transporter EutH
MTKSQIPIISQSRSLWPAALITILVTGFAIRIMGYQSPIDMDERPMIMNVAHFASKQTIVPSHFQYPTFYSYLITPAIALYSLLLLLLGKIRSLG